MTSRYRGRIAAPCPAADGAFWGPSHMSETTGSTLFSDRQLEGEKQNMERFQRLSLIYHLPQEANPVS